MKNAFLYLSKGYILAPITFYVEKYVFSDWEFLKFLFVICSVDTALGVVRAIKDKEISSKGFSMVFNKIITYSAALIATHVLVHFTVDHKTNLIFSFFDSMVFSAIVAREGISIFEKISLISPNSFSTKVLKYLKQFDSITGKPKRNEEPVNNNEPASDGMQQR